MSTARIPILTRSEATFVNSRDIIYAESQLRLVLLSAKRRQYRYYGKLDDLMQFLGRSFYRCHISWIINFDEVVSIRNNAIYMSDGKVILLGRNKYQATRRAYIEYLRNDAGASDPS
jgi:DNA-binding LytR/AlgR family response regulator